ncbi:YncE family protein [Larkinella sp. VNQ87]|uniref:YncE family protein n=1 Tax=Larkinella sp. VNQ87 TaxID=3400921 RepID=UPI003C03B3F3
MKKMNTASAVRLKLALSLLVALNWSCKNDNDDPAAVPYGSGVVVINSGNFLQNNGSLSFLNRSSKTASYDIFSLVNQRTLTGGVQGYAEVDGKGLILVDNSTAAQDKLEIIDANTFKSLATLKTPEIENPRYAVKVGTNKAYVSCWDVSGDFANGTFYKDPGYVAVVDLSTNTVTKKINVPKGPEAMVVVGNEVFLGSVGEVKNLTVIDINTDAVKAPVEIGTNPSPVGVDANNKLWISSGNEIVRVNPQTKAVENRLKVGTSTTKSPGTFRMSPDKQTIYFVYSFYDPADNFKQKGETYRFSVNDTTIPATTPFINRLFSGLDIDPTSGTIYAGFTPSYGQAGYVYRFQPNGTLIDSVRAEIAPTGFYFK